jgi:hypothetical protein
MAVSEQQPFQRTRGEVPCSNHPGVMTGLRCSRCGKPICPRCGVRTPVGLRCPDCAGVRGLPTYRTSSNTLLKAAGAGLAVALVVGGIWGYLPDWQFYLSLALGFGVAEAMAWAANYKRGRDLQVIGIAFVVLGLVIARVLLAQRYGITLEQVNALEDNVWTEGIREEFGFPVSVATALQLRIIPDLIFAGIAVVIPWVRFR